MIGDLEAYAAKYLEVLSTRQMAAFYNVSVRQSKKAYHACIDAGLLKPRPARTPTNTERKAALVEATPPIDGRLRAPATPQVKRGDGITRFILTAAQNNTFMHDPLWENIQALAHHYNARILVARNVYNRFARASGFDKKLIIERDEGYEGQSGRVKREYTWDERLREHFYDERLELAPGLVWCGETNILPSVANPLAGLESYTGRASTIIPHPRIAMRSIPSHPSEGTKMMYTTGTLTQRNYIQRKAGQLAEYHHCYGGLLVEVDRNGTWFVRQLNANSEGTICDWDVRVEKGHVSTGNSLEAITWGDIHVAYGDPVTYKLAWGEGGMLDTLRPRYQFMHDLIDFRARNSHNIKLGLALEAFLEYVKGHVRVEDEMKTTAKFLDWAARDWCQTIVVDSNHDHFLIEWLNKTGDFRKDPANAVYFLKAAHELWSKVETTGNMPNMTRWAMYQANDRIALKNIRFLDQDESFIICPDAHGGIEGGLHGHERFNGARGGPTAFAKTGRKTNIGHAHSAGIYDGTYQAGLMGLLKQGYNSGMGSWSQSNILTYPTGKRAIQTIYDGKARA